MPTCRGSFKGRQGEGKAALCIPASVQCGASATACCTRHRKHRHIAQQVLPPSHWCSQLTSATRPLSMTTVWSAFRTVLSLHSMAQHSTAGRCHEMSSVGPAPACCKAAAAQLLPLAHKRCSSRLGTWHAEGATVSAPVGNDNHGPPIGAHRSVQCRLHRGLALYSSRVSNRRGLRQRQSGKGRFPAAAQQQHG